MSAEPDLEDAPEAEEAAPRPAARHQNEPTEPSAGRGTPAGQLALGLFCVLAIGGLGLYNLLGALGLAVGGAGTVTCAGGYGYWRWRRAHPNRNRAHRTPRSSGNHTSKGLNLGGSTGRSGRRMTFGATSGAGRGRTAASARMPSLGGSRTSGKAAGRHVFGGLRTPGGHSGGRGRGAFRPGHGGGHAAGKTPRRGTVASAAHKVSTPFRTTGRAGRTIGRRAAQAGRAVRQKAAPRIARAREASRALDARTGHLASRAGTRIAKAARAADQRTGGRLGRAWRAARPPQRIRRTWQAIRRLDDRLTRRAAAHPALNKAWGRIRGLAEQFGLLKPRPAAPEQAPAEAPPTPETASAAPAPTAPTRTFPVRAPSRTPARRPFHMSANGSPLIVVSADMIGSVSRYLPQDMWDVARDLDQLHQVPENVARALGVYTKNLDAAYPIDRRVIGMMSEFYAGVATTSAMAQEIARGFRKVHVDDIKRRDAPRAGEHLWNV